jgi:glutamine amidotransferase
MCRLVAHLGAPVTLGSLLYDPEHSLEHQAWAPREQRYGTINADGWGVGWYDLDVRPEPARYRHARPMWSDGSFRSMAGLLRSSCVLAAVRSATAPAIVDESNTPPYVGGRWLFAHNGAVAGWRDGINTTTRGLLRPTRGGEIEGSTDSETLFALALQHLDDGGDPAGALESAVAAIVGHAATEGRLNMVLTDGTRMAASVWGDTLYVAHGEGGVDLASEPLDGTRPWEPIDDRTVVTVDADGIRVRPLDPAAHQHRTERP